MTIRELYEKHKTSIVAIYLTGSMCLGLESIHDEDYDIYFNSTDDYEKVRGDIEMFRRSFQKRPDVFIHYVGETHTPSFYSYQFRYWQLLYGTAVEGLYNILEHKEEVLALIKRLIPKTQGKKWYHVYILTKVLYSGSYELTDADRAIIADLYANGISDTYKTNILQMIANM